MIDYKKIVHNFLVENKLDVNNLTDRTVQDIYLGFKRTLPDGITVSKRMFLKQIRLILPLDAKPGYKYIKTGEYETITKFVRVERLPDLIELGFTIIADTRDVITLQIPQQCKVEIKKEDGSFRIYIAPEYWIDSETAGAIAREANKYGKG